MTELDEGEEFTELVDADFPRIDLVNKGANGVPFLIAKSADGGLLPAEVVRALADEGAEPVAKERDDVTLSGSPGAIARMIHEAAQRAPVAKAPTAAERKHDAATGAAMPDGSYPIENKAQLQDAIHAVGRGGASHDAIRRHIISRARSLGAASEIPDTWNNDGSLKEANVSKQESAEADVAKADGPDLEAGDVVADAGGGSTADTVPGSPDWEARDSETALNAVSVLGRVKAAIEWLSDREATEAVTGDGSEVGDSMCLTDLACAIDCVIRELAGFAATETLEAELPDEVDDVVEKGIAAAGSLVEPLGVLERFAPVVKAGRVLSSANEAAIRQAADSLQKVLASLPAPVTDDQPVAKEKESTVDETTDPVAKADAPAEPVVEPAVEEAPVEKAKGDPQLVVFDEEGHAIGIVDPKNLVPIAKPGGGSGSGDAASSDEADDAGADAGSDAGSDAAADAGDAAAAAPAAAAEDGTVVPGTETVAAPAQPGASEDEDDSSVQKAAATGSLTAAFAEALAPLMERLGAQAELAEVVKGLEERVEHLAAMPDDRKSPLLNGQIGGGAPVADDPFVHLQKAVEDAKSDSERAQAQAALAHARVKARFAR